MVTNLIAPPQPSEISIWFKESRKYKGLEDSSVWESPRERMSRECTDLLMDFARVLDNVTDGEGTSARLSSERAPALDRLEAAAEAGDECAFLEALESITWYSRPPADFIRAVRLALEAGAHLAARQIALEGAKYYPEDSEIGKYARVLAPPRLVSKNLQPNPARRANREWLKVHGGEYRGQWVAVQDGELRGVAESLRQLIKQVGRTKDVLLTRVP